MVGKSLWLMFADEADPDGSTEYFVSAAVFIPSDTAHTLHDEIEKIRGDYGFADGDDLKFSVATKPKQVTPRDHTSAKQRTLAAATNSSVEPAMKTLAATCRLKREVKTPSPGLWRVAVAGA